MKFTSLILLCAAVAVQGRTVGGVSTSSALINVDEDASNPAPMVQGIAWEDTVEDFPTTEFPFDVVDEYGDEGDDYS